MSDTYHITFIYNPNRISIDFYKKQTVREMISEFLRATNSIMTVEQKKILFLCDGKILNSKVFLDINLENLLGRQTNKNIKVQDKGKIIGGVTNAGNKNKPFKL